MGTDLDTALHMAELLIIKRDFDLMKKIAIQLKPELQMQLTPYTALFCYEVLDYLNKHGQQIELAATSRYSIKQIRQKAKFFDLSVSKLLQSVENIRLFLLHVLSSIGFILYVLKKVIIRETRLLIRFEYIAYHYALLRLDGLMRYCNENPSAANDIRY